MYTSDTRRKLLKTAFSYTVITIVCALIGFVYELFSHQVYSLFMIYAFAFPLILGALPYISSAFFLPQTLNLEFLPTTYHLGVATLTVGSFIKGVLEIYGTTNSISVIYWYLGIVLIASAVVVFALKLYKNKKSMRF